MKLLEEARKLEWQGMYLERFHGEASCSKPMTFAWLKWENTAVEVEVGMFELLANLLKTRVFDDIRSIPVPTRKCRVCGVEDETAPPSGGVQAVEFHLLQSTPRWRTKATGLVSQVQLWLGREDEAVVRAGDAGTSE